MVVLCPCATARSRQTETLENTGKHWKPLENAGKSRKVPESSGKRTKKSGTYPAFFNTSLICKIISSEAKK
jgi:hypothetical protein